MSRKNKDKPVNILAIIVSLWLLGAVVLPLLEILPLIIVGVILYKTVFKKSGEKVKEDAAEKQQTYTRKNTVYTEEPQEYRHIRQEPARPVKETVSTGNPEVDRLIKERDLAINEMRRLNLNIEDEKISQQIDDMQYTTSKIFDHVIAHPDKLPQINKFLNYYLPTTMKLLNTYDRMGSQGVEGDNITGTMKKVEDTLDMVVNAFHKQLDTLFAGEALDVSADISVMENLMRKEGLAGDEISEIKLTLSER